MTERRVSLFGGLLRRMEKKRRRRKEEISHSLFSHLRTPNVDGVASTHTSLFPERAASEKIDLSSKCIIIRQSAVCGQLYLSLRRRRSIHNGMDAERRDVD